MSVGKYLDFKLFEFFRDRMQPLVNYKREKEVTTDLYKHIFMAPSDMKEKTSARLNGVKFPFFCLWSDNVPQLYEPTYGKSVLPREIQYHTTIDDPDNPGTDLLVYGHKRGNLVDYELPITVFASSYFKTFVTDVAEDLVALDMLRVIDLDMSEIIPGYVSRMVIKKKSISTTEMTDEGKSERQFSLIAKFQCLVTVPLIDKESLVDAVRLYLNSDFINQFPTAN